MRLSAAAARHRAAEADHGVLATRRPDGRIDLVPAVFVLEADLLAIPIDRVKPKLPGRLQRERNLEAHPGATFLVERWDANDWSRLWWVRLGLTRIEPDATTTERLASALRRRYPQYTASASLEAVIVFRIEEASGWSAESHDPTVLA